MTIFTPITADNVINDAESVAVPISGQGAEPNETVIVTISIAGALSSFVTTADGNGDWSVIGDVSGIARGDTTATISAYSSNGAETSLTETVMALVDVDYPSLSFSTPISGDGKVNQAESSSVALTGTFLGAPVPTITVSDGTNSVALTAMDMGSGIWSTNVDLTSFLEGTIFLTAQTQDTAGNAIIITHEIFYDSTAPPVTLSLPMAGDNVINIAEIGRAHV